MIWIVFFFFFVYLFSFFFMMSSPIAHYLHLTLSCPIRLPALFSVFLIERKSLIIWNWTSCVLLCPVSLFHYECCNFILELWACWVVGADVKFQIECQFVFIIFYPVSLSFVFKHGLPFFIYGWIPCDLHPIHIYIFLVFIKLNITQPT